MLSFIGVITVGMWAAMNSNSLIGEVAWVTVLGRKGMIPTSTQARYCGSSAYGRALSQVTLGRPSSRVSRSEKSKSGPINTNESSGRRSATSATRS